MARVPGSKLAAGMDFEDDAAAVGRDIQDFRKKVVRASSEFDLLLDYYLRNQGRLEFSTTREGQAGALGGTLKPNLGTADPSWFYVDERGNRIWVRNVTLDSVKAASYGGFGTTKTGAFEETEHADGRFVAVRVPKPKRHYSLAADYRRKCVDAEAEWASRYGASVTAARIEGTLGAAAATGWSSTAHVHNLRHHEHGCDAAVSDAAWAATQRSLASMPGDATSPRAYAHAASASAIPAAVHRANAAFVPPATVGEAEARLQALRVQERELLKQLAA